MRREVVCADAVEWLRRPGVVPEGACVLTSLPDSSEVRAFAPTIEAWQAWFVEAARAVLQALPPRAIAVFYQTDVRLPGIGQVSKAYLVLKAAAEVDGAVLLWHKVVHFGSIDQQSSHGGSVGFTHLLCFWRQGVGSETFEDCGSMVPDIVARGQKPWRLRKAACCMGANATLSVLKWVRRRLPNVDTVIDPFCGAGTVLAIGNTLGLRAIGVDISRPRCKQAARLDGARLLAGPGAAEKDDPDD